MHGGVISTEMCHPLAKKSRFGQDRGIVSLLERSALKIAAYPSTRSDLVNKWASRSSYGALRQGMAGRNRARLEAIGERTPIELPELGPAQERLPGPPAGQAFTAAPRLYRAGRPASPTPPGPATVERLGSARRLGRWSRALSSPRLAQGTPDEQNSRQNRSGLSCRAPIQHQKRSGCNRDQDQICMDRRADRYKTPEDIGDRDIVLYIFPSRHRRRMAWRKAGMRRFEGRRIAGWRQHASGGMDGGTGVR